MNPPKDAKKNNLGPTGETVRENVVRLRGAMQYKELSERLSAIGRPIHPVSLKRIETGERRVDADDLMALAIALETTTNALLLPRFGDGSPLELTGAADINFWDAWWWAEGSGTLKPLEPAAKKRFIERSRPVDLTERQDPKDELSGLDSETLMEIRRIGDMIRRQGEREEEADGNS